MTKICYVSLFLDLEREKWKTFSRSFSNYLNRFRPFITMFSKPNTYKDEEDTFEYEMVVFLDKKHVEIVKREFKPETNIKIIEIDREYLHTNFYGWKNFEREKEIMGSKKYKELLGERVGKYPENTNPEYTSITHCKIDAVAETAKSYSNAEYFAWVDFGYFSSSEIIPTNMIDIYKLNLNTVNFSLINSPTEKDKDPIYTVTEAPECIVGGFFFGRRDLILEYQRQYHITLDYFQNKLELADDEQHLALFTYFRKPELFTLHHLGVWYTLTYFQKDPMYNAKYDLLSFSHLNKLQYLPKTLFCNIMDKYGKSGNYTILYHSLFTGQRERKMNILKIGMDGIRGWKEYFINSTIYTSDTTILEYLEDRIIGFYLDQKNTSCIIEQFYDHFRDVQFDIIIDEGIQHFKTNWSMLKLLYPKLKKGGYYIIKDIIDYELKVMGRPNFPCSYIQVPDSHMILAIKNH